MRTVAALSVVSLVLAGCGGVAATPTTKTATSPPTAPDGLRVGIVGALSVHVPGAVVEHGTIGRVGDSPLVVVAAGDPAAARVREAAVAHPVVHYAVAGASQRAARLPNLTGLVVREDEAAGLGGLVAGIVVTDEGGSDSRVAWVGPRERTLVDAFVRGVHKVAPGTVVLRATSPDRPAACKEAALGAIARGATVVMARGGVCASAAIAGAHQQNHPGLRLSDFILLDVPAAQVVRDAVAGIYHGGEDIVFGAGSGAIGVRRLDPRISATTEVRAKAAAQELANGRSPSG